MQKKQNKCRTEERTKSQAKAWSSYLIVAEFGEEWGGTCKGAEVGTGAETRTEGRGRWGGAGKSRTGCRWFWRICRCLCCSCQIRFATIGDRRGTKPPGSACVSWGRGKAPGTEFGEAMDEEDVAEAGQVGSKDSTSSRFCSRPWVVDAGRAGFLDCGLGKRVSSVKGRQLEDRCESIISRWLSLSLSFAFEEEVSEER